MQTECLLRARHLLEALERKMNKTMEGVVSWIWILIALCHWLGYLSCAHGPYL